MTQTAPEPFTEAQYAAVLCYVCGDWAYFTTQALEKQWGDDWNDAPYEHNAGQPYWPHNEKDGATWEILRLSFSGPFFTPDGGEINSPYSVEDINGGAVPWLRPDGCVSGCGVFIHAGTTLRDFLQLVPAAGGQVFVPFRPEGSPAGGIERAESGPAWGDRPLPEDAEIDAAFPTRTGRHDLYAEALRLVGARQSKAALVGLVNWLLTRCESEQTKGGEINADDNGAPDQRVQ